MERWKKRRTWRRQRSQVFRRLRTSTSPHVNEDGSAVRFHPKPERLEQLVFATTALDTARRLEHKSRWARVSAFETIPSALRVDRQWLDTLPKQDLVETIIELQPLLSRSEIDTVSRAIGLSVQPYGGSLRWYIWESTSLAAHGFVESFRSDRFENWRTASILCNRCTRLCVR